MHLPTPQFSRLVTLLAFDLSDQALDSMILTWDHIAARFLDRLPPNDAMTGKIESIRLLSIHDAAQAIFTAGSGCVYTGLSSGQSLDAALAATAQASHDILAAVFDSPEDRIHLDDALEESLSLIADEGERTAGVATGQASARAYAGNLAPLAVVPHHPANRPFSQDDWRKRPHRPSLRLAANPQWHLDWQRSA